MTACLCAIDESNAELSYSYLVFMIMARYGVRELCRCGVDAPRLGNCVCFPRLLSRSCSNCGCTAAVPYPSPRLLSCSSMQPSVRMSTHVRNKERLQTTCWGITSSRPIDRPGRHVDLIISWKLACCMVPPCQPLVSLTLAPLMLPLISWPQIRRWTCVLVPRFLAWY